MKSGTGTNYFPSGGNVLGGDYGVAKTAKDAGLKKLAVIYCAEFPACAGVGDLYKKIAADVGGIQVASTGAISATAPNYIPQCLKIKQSGADSMYIADSPPPVVKMIDDCAKQSVKLKSFEQAGIVTPDLAKSPSAQGLQSMYGNMPLSDTSTPGGKYVNQMIDKYAPQMRSAPNWNESLTAVWAALELFKKAATAGNVGPNSTRDDVYNAMYNIRNETLGGLSPALTFVKGKGNHIGCWYTATIKGGKVVADGSTPQCVPAAQVPALEKALGA
jgi:branched-chain amino acid transport system substrate-binding protein